MKVIAQRQRIEQVAASWENTYRKGTVYYTEEKADKLKRLKALDLSTATAQEVNEIIGNASWTDIKCDDCGKAVTKVIQLGEEPDLESYTANICQDCLDRAVILMKGK